MYSCVIIQNNNTNYTNMEESLNHLNKKFFAQLPEIY